MSEYIVSIDLGTSNCCMSYATKDNKKVEVLTYLGKKICPSVVYYKQDGTYETGWTAANRYQKNDGVVNYMKRIFAKKFDDVPDYVKDSCKSKVVKGPKGFAAFQVYEETKLPETVFTDLVKDMREQLITKCSDDGNLKVKKVVVTIPSNYIQDQIVLTKRIIRNAGFDCEVTTLPEPVAACMAYDVSAMTDKGYFMVFDIGGGTCDVALLQLNGSNFNVKDHAGNNVGGALFDSIIRDWVVDEIENKRSIRIVIPDDDPRKQLAEKILLDICKEAKENLSALPSVDIDLIRYFEKLCVFTDSSDSDDSAGFSDSDDSAGFDEHNGRHNVIQDTLITFDRTTLNKLIGNHINDCIELIHQVLVQNGLKHTDITKIILVGGSSRLSLIEAKINNIFGRDKMSFSINPDECVSRGACGFAISGAAFSDCLHHNIYHCVGRPDDPDNYRILLKEHTALPCSSSHQCTIKPRPTSYYLDYIYQGISPETATKLAPMIVYGFTYDPKHPVTVTYTIKVNEERILTYSVTDDTTKKVLVEDSIFVFSDM